MIATDYFHKLFKWGLVISKLWVFLWVEVQIEVSLFVCVFAAFYDIQRYPSRSLLSMLFTNIYDLSTLTRVWICDDRNDSVYTIFYYDRLVFLVRWSIPKTYWSIWGSHFFAMKRYRDIPLSSKNRPCLMFSNFS